MRAVARSACTWPDRTSVHQWWQHSLRLDKVVVGPDGTVQGLDSAPVVRLLAGQHLAPGARYRVDDPGLTVGEASISVDGQASVRTVHAAYRDLRSSDDTVALDLIGLDTPRSVVSSSTLRYLRWKFELHYRRDQLLSLSVDLDWLRVRVRARVLESADGDQLELRVSVRGAGLWRPTLAPLLAAVSLFAHNGVREMADDIAQALTDVAEDPTGDPVARERRRARERALQRVAQQEAALGEAMQVFSDQLHQVEDLVDARPWWRRGRRGWRACFDEVCGPLPTESPPIPMFGTRTAAPILSCCGGCGGR